MSEKIKVRYAKKVELDFGLFPNGEGEIIVDKDFWIEYIDKRLAFEQMHDTLWRKLEYNKRNKLLITFKEMEAKE